MNNTMGRYIDEGTDEVRDRIVTAENMNNGLLFWDPEDCSACLVGTGEGLSKEKTSLGLDHLEGTVGGTKWPDLRAAYRYLHAVQRFGGARIIRAVKLRAGAKVEEMLREEQNAHNL